MVGLVDENLPQIPAFYAGRNIFITGATGFMGKVLVERLLSTCPDIGNLYLLMRTKRDVLPEKRLVQFKQSPVFDNLVQRCPAQLEKLRVISGDTTKPQLGMNTEDIAVLRDISVVFHVAATVKFDEEMSLAVDQNVRAAISIMDLCDQMQNLEVFVHVSTAYSMCELSVVEERVYPPPITADQLCNIVDSMPSKLLAEIVPTLLGPKPNTYTFTKAIAESAVAGRKTHYGVAIFRPTIVISSIKDPLPGWVENLNGPSGVVVAVGKGLMHTFRCDLSATCDMLPVDLGIDTLIATAWYTAISRPQTPFVINCSTCENPSTWKNFIDGLYSLEQYPFNSMMWYPSGMICQNKYMFKIFEAVLHTLPLYSAEYFMRIMGIKSRINLITVNDKMSSMVKALSFFSLNEWKFKTENFKLLRKTLSEADKAIYNLDPHSIQWNEQYKRMVIGARKFIMKEEDKDMDSARSNMRKYYYLHKGLQALLFLLSLRTLFSFIPSLKQAVYGLLYLLLSAINNTFKRIVLPS